MKLSYQELTPHLAKTLAPVYLIHSDELLLAQEAADQIRAAARTAGYSERVSLDLESADWGKILYAELHTLSLFAAKRIIELQLGAAKPNAAASKLLQEVAASLPANTLLLIRAHKLDGRTEKTAWVKAIEKSGVLLPVWPITADQLPTWILQRAKKSGVELTRDAAKFLAEQVEGNLLAAGQEIEKIALLTAAGKHAGKPLDSAFIAAVITDNARFDIFSLVECALGGNSQRALRILENLRAEGIEPVLILWALTREIRMLAEMQRLARQGTSLGSLFSQYRIWEKRQPGVRRCLQTHSQKSCWKLLLHCSKIDRIIKGATKANIWDELKQLVFTLTGSDIIGTMSPD
jgi:DNA polymerase-3 subunit delta